MNGMEGWSGPHYRALKAKTGPMHAKADVGGGGGAANAGPRLAVSDVAISGVLTKEAVSKILNEQAAGFEKYLLDAANASKLTVRLTIRAGRRSDGCEGPEGCIRLAEGRPGGDEEMDVPSDRRRKSGSRHLHHDSGRMSR